jgi:hypothetical protein
MRVEALIVKSRVGEPSTRQEKTGAAAEFS